MSSRHIRRLMATKEKIQSDEEDDEDYEDIEDDDDEPHAQQNTKFQGLDISSDSESEKREEESHGDTSLSTSAIAGPSSGHQQFRSSTVPEEDKYGAKKKTYTQAELAKKEKLARKKLKKNKQRNVQKEDVDIHRLSEQMSCRFGIQSQRADETVVDKKEQRKNQLFYINPHHLDVNNELAKVYGNKDKKSPTPLNRRASHWIGVSPEIKAIRIKGIVMSRYKTDGWVKYFRFTHNQEYRSRVHDLIKTVKARLNGQGHHGNLLHSITCVEACLENSDILYSLEEHSEGRLSVEQCLFCMQSVADPSFSYVDGNTRLLYDFVENRPFLIALLKYIYILSNTACYITALALAKVLLNLDPKDPLCLLFIIDTLAIRARQFEWLRDLVEAWREARNADNFFNMRYSRALAMFYIGRRTKEGDKEATIAMYYAVLFFPSVIMKITELAQISVPDDIKKHVLFNPPANFPVPSSDLQQLMNLYAWLTAPRWREPFIVEWILKVLREATVRYDGSSELRKVVLDNAKVIAQVYRRFPTELNRHLSAIRSMSNYIGNIPPILPTVAFNPYPNRGQAIDTYDYFNNGSQDEEPHGSIIRSFIEAIVPNFDRFGQEEAASLSNINRSEVVINNDHYRFRRMHHVPRGTSMSRAEEPRVEVRIERYPRPQIFEMEEVEINYRIIGEIDDYLTQILFAGDEMLLPTLTTKVIVIYLLVGIQMICKIKAGKYILDVRNNGYIIPPLD